MDLKDFVSETLQSIIAGVTDAQKKAEAHGALVNPGGLMRKTDAVSDNSIWDNRFNVFAQPVQFDVAITAEDSASGGAKIKVLPAIIGADVGGERERRNMTVTRVQFQVPVLFPPQDVGDPAARKNRVK